VTVTFSLGTDSSSNPANSGDAGPSSESSAVSRYEDVVVVAVDVGESDCGGSCWCEPFAADDDGDAVLRCREAGRVNISGAARDLAARGTRHLDPLAFSRVSPRAFPVGSLVGVAFGWLPPFCFRRKIPCKLKGKMQVPLGINGKSLWLYNPLAGSCTEDERMLHFSWCWSVFTTILSTLL
jgi:hypothetical protein